LSLVIIDILNNVVEFDDTIKETEEPVKKQEEIDQTKVPQLQLILV
jgi:hypothetical protein